jgi:ATP-dependent DNA helicase RecG
MKKEDLQRLLRLGEGYALEFKRSPAHLGREICAFANAGGGRILVGVDDQGRVVGVSKPNRTKSEIQSIARNIDPPLSLTIELVDKVLVVTVPSGPNKPYAARGLFYLREAASSQRMRRDEIRDFLFREGMIRFDEQFCSEFEFPKDFNGKQYAVFRRMAKIPNKLKKVHVLQNLRLLGGEGMTNAGVLLLGKDIPRFHLQAAVSCALFQGTSKSKILDRAVFHGTIVDNYNNAMSYLRSHLNTEYVIKDGPREEILEMPEEALRESIINALGHRDYRSTAHIQIHIFLDRVEIINPGGLLPGIKLKDLGRISRPRNLLLFSMMARMDLVEHIGSGIQRIREVVRGYGLKVPIFESDGNWFAVTLRRKSQHAPVDRHTVHAPSPTVSDEGVSEGVSEGIPEGVNRLLAFVRQYPGLRTPQISAAMDVPVKTLERWIKILRFGGKIEFRGSPKTGGYWITVPKAQLQDD